MEKLSPGQPESKSVGDISRKPSITGVILELPTPCAGALEDIPQATPDGSKDSAAASPNWRAAALRTPGEATPQSA